MNTPTPEDIALATKIAGEVVASLYRETTIEDNAAQLIADHCAPLHERIALLEPIAIDHVAHDLDAQDLQELVRTLERECDQLERDREYNAGLVMELKPLAEIGRLAVEHRRARQAYHGRIKMRTEAEEETLWNDWTRKELKLVDACDAYIAKEGK